MSLKARKDVSPTELVKEALTAAKAKSINRQQIDWEGLEPNILHKAEACQTLTEAHEVIRELLKELNDEHSFLWTPDNAKKAVEANHSGLRVHQLEPVVIDVFPDSPAERANIRVGDVVTQVDGTPIKTENWQAHIRRVLNASTKLELAGENSRTITLESGFVRPNPSPQGYLFEGCGVIDLPGTWGEGELADGSDYGQITRDLLHELESQGAKAWIVDLRRNDGGNMWPMLAGLTPLLGVGEYGSFVKPGDDGWVWAFDGEQIGAQQNGSFFEDYAVEVEAFKPLVNPDVPVAVLTSAVTSSSGEIVLIGLLGHPKTRSFGLGTGGIPTSNEMITLADGSWLLLTTYYCADRLGCGYKGVIEPDERVDIDWNAFAQAHDPVLAAARQWVGTQLE